VEVYPLLPEEQPQAPVHALVPVDPAVVAAPGNLEIPEEWGVNTPQRIEQVRKSKKAASVKHGLLSSIPMICRDTECPYKAHCVYQKRGEVVAGDRCVLEIGKLMSSAEQYYAEFGIDPTDPGQRTDAVIVQQILTLEILINRCEMLLATGNLVEEIDVAMNPSGDVIQQPQLHKAAEALPKLQHHHNQKLNLLMATRKDKIQAAATIGMSIDQFTKQMLERAQMVDARLAHMRAGENEAAEKLGIKYALEVHKDEFTDAEFREVEQETNPTSEG
jgi:hypothetical protein